MSETALWVQLLGWISSAVLLLTLSRQVYSEWRSHSSKGVSRWLFVGQISASVGFTVYSLMLHNWVFVVSNAGILAVAIVAQIIFLRQRADGPKTNAPAAPP